MENHVSCVRTLTECGQHIGVSLFSGCGFNDECHSQYNGFFDSNSMVFCSAFSA